MPAWRPRARTVARGRVKTQAFNLRVESPSRFRQSKEESRCGCVRKKGNRENNSPPCWLLSVFTQPRWKAVLRPRPLGVAGGAGTGHLPCVTDAPNGFHTQVLTITPLQSAPIRPRGTLGHRPVFSVSCNLNRPISDCPGPSVGLAGVRSRPSH